MLTGMKGKHYKLFVGTAIFLVFAVIVAAGSLLSGAVPKTGAFEEPETHMPTQTATQKIKLAKPDQVQGILLHAGNASLEGDSMQQQADALALQLQGQGFNAVFVDVGDTYTDYLIQEENQQWLHAILQAAKTNNLYSAVMLCAWNEADLGNNAQLDVYRFCQEFEMESVVLTGAPQEEQSVYTDVQQLSNAAISADNLLAVALATDVSHAAACEQVLQNALVQALYYMPATQEEAKTQAYLETAQKLHTLTQDNVSEFWSAYDTALLREAVGGEMVQSLVEQMEATKDSCTAQILQMDSLVSDPTSADAAIVLEYLQSGNSNAAKKFSLTSHDNTSITTNESKITLSGTSHPDYELQCNGNAVERLASGDFSTEMQLTPGENTFVFTHRGESYTYKVTYQVVLIKSANPTGTISGLGGTKIEVTAVALRAANVYATINGTRVSMKRGDAVQGDDNNSADSSSDYVTYTGTYTLPAAKATVQNLGSIKITATLNALSQSKTGAALKVNAKVAAPVLETPTTTEKPTEKPTEGDPTTQPPGTTTPPATTTPPTTGTQGKQLTPYANNGVSGKSKMCEITTDYAETLPSSVLNQKSASTFSPLLKGTFDYVLDEATYNNQKYYYLGSGRRVKAGDVKLIASGYNMPLNKVGVLSSSADSNSTNIVFSLDWKVVSNIKVNGQSYIPASQAHGGYEYEVKSFTATGLDITFYYTGSYSGTPNFAKSNVIKSSQWIVDKNNQTVTLRLTLREAGGLYGYTFAYDANGSLVLKVKGKPSTSLKGATIMLDPGHGGVQPGATCVVNNSTFPTEKQITLSIGKKVKALLEAEGATVVMSRTADTSILLADIRTLTRKNNPDVFVSIHCDSFTSSSARGTTAYYYYPQSYPLANSINTALVSMYKNDIYKGQSSTVLNAVNRGSRYDYFFVTRVENCPAVLIEYGFISNMEECKVLQTSANQDKLAKATVTGIKNYLAS